MSHYSTVLEKCSATIIRTTDSSHVFPLFQFRSPFRRSGNLRRGYGKIVEVGDAEDLWTKYKESVGRRQLWNNDLQDQLLVEISHNSVVLMNKSTNNKSP